MQIQNITYQLISLLRFIYIISCIISLSSCNQKNKITEKTIINTSTLNDTTIIDCNYTFEEAIAGTRAPEHIIQQLELITVKYYSMDGKIHQGQILTNKQISKEIAEIFDFMLEVKFPVFQAVPIVRFNWKDKLSMEANNTYSFCYRNVSYSKHAQGMAIDINPMQNPLIWKHGYLHRKNVPEGAVYNPETPGTLTPEHPVVEKFKSFGFTWGYHFRRNFDKHHFEKK